MKPIYTIS